jgi:uncharacterized protein (DUF2141 family)
MKMTHNSNIATFAKNTPARLKALALCTGSAALFSLAGFANAQAANLENTDSTKPAAQSQQVPAEAPSVDDKFKPRIYGAPTPAPAPVAPTSPAQKPVEQQVNVILNENATSIPVPEKNVELEIPSHILPNAELNSAPNWTNGIRAQFIDVIAGVPILKDPENCAAGNPSLRIKVVNVKKSKGIIVADLHDDVKENFLVWDKVVLRVRATATEDETFFCMPVPKPGNYSVAIYHDKNSNAFFDKNFLGLPKERFGMSNNPKFTTKSPKYEQATFTVPEEGVDMLIKLRRSSDVISGNQD